MTPARRRWGWVLGAVALVALLAGGRWAALDTAERLWAATIPGGDVYLDGRGLATLFRVAIFIIAVSWATANLYLVSRTIGAVQLPRRLGDLDIVETVSRGALHLAVVGGGLVVGVVLTWGTGDWWLAAVLATDPPRFGVQDPVLGHDLGYYVSSLRWTGALQDHVLLAVATVALVVVLLYVGIGAIALQGTKLRAGLRTRLHVGVLLVALAAALAWGALLDPAEVVGGLHGPVDAAALRVRVPGAGAIVGLAVAAVLGTLVWMGTARGGVVLGVWGGLLAALPLAYLVAPSVVRGPRGGRAAAVLDRDARDLTERAFGLRWLAREPPPFIDPADAMSGLALWDAERVARVARIDRVLGRYTTVGGVTLVGDGSPGWLIGPATDETALREARPIPSWTDIHLGAWSTHGPPFVATEVDSGLAFRPVAATDDTRFAPGMAQFAVLPPGSAAAPGIALTGRWRRWALAWALQSTNIAGAEVEGGTLLWRREVGERLARLAPFATFGAARPVLADGALWWIAPGYVTSPAFPLIQSLAWRGERVRFVHAGFIGAVQAGSGLTRVVLAPGYDSLSAAWARAFAPLVQPVDSLPTSLRAQIAPPADGFSAALAAALRVGGDTSWTARPQTSYDVLAPAPGAPPGSARVTWLAQGFVTGTPPRVAAVFASAMTDAGPVHVWWRPDPEPPAPGPVVGASELRRGQERIWPAVAGLAAAQAQFVEPAPTTLVPSRPRLAGVYFAWGDKITEGPSRGAALAALLAGETGFPPFDAERWRRARRLLAQADSALRVGDMARFGRLYDDLRRLFGFAGGSLAPPGSPR